MIVTAPTIFIKSAYFAYENTILFKDLNLTLTAGKCTCLLGPSGVGKTTLLHLIAGIISPHAMLQGEITCDEKIRLSQHVAYMAQTDLLMPWLTALENALLSTRLTTKKTEKITYQALGLFEQVGLKGAENKYPQQLSGGMRQRVALVRTLLQNKPVVLLDEPFSSVDAITRFQLQTLTATFLKNRTTLFITHDPLEALRLADEIYILSGVPATLKRVFTLTSNTPRDMASPEILSHQADLFHALSKANGGSL